MLSAGKAYSIAEAPEPHDFTGTSVEEWAVERLRTSPYSALRNLSCQYQDGSLLLRGKLASFYLKQLAQAIVAQVAGIERIENCIEVRPERPLAYACALSFTCLCLCSVLPDYRSGAETYLGGWQPQATNQWLGTQGVVCEVAQH